VSGSFQELGLDPALDDALAALGFESPTPLQEQAIPVLRRENDATLAAGPGAGTLLAWGAPLLDRIPEEDAGSPAAVAVVPDRETARRRAESLARLAAFTGHHVAALGSIWASPESAHVVFGTPGDLLGAVQEARLDLSGLTAFVVDGGAAVETRAGLREVLTLLETLDGGVQRILVSLPVSPALEELADAHLRRAVTLPPSSVSHDAEASPDRGVLRYRVVSPPREAAVLVHVARSLEEGARHVLVFVRDEDRAADLGDDLELHGFPAGAPGDPGTPVWMGVGELDALRAVSDWEGVEVVSADVPAGPDALDRRHGGERGGILLVLPRELAHLRDVAWRTGYRLQAHPLPPETRVSDDLVDTLDRLERALAREDVAPYLVILETLFEEHDPAEVAAAAVALLRRRPDAAGGATSAKAGRATDSAPSSGAPTTWTRLYLSVGSRDGAGPGDLLGAIIGEADVDGDQVGRIDLRESFSIVEVQSPVAEQVIEALNGTTVRGRSVRADYDRGSKERARGAAGGRDRGSGRPGGRGSRTSR
jgi:ATP-dependent RNA helicase DeaD